MKEPSEIPLADGTVWQFQKRIVEEGSGLTEITASDITELVNYRSELEKGNEEQREIMSRLEEISRDVVEITRNEEILAMKMRIHSELGLALSSTRHFIASGCPASDKKEYAARQREMARKLLLQTDMDDETDLFADLKKTAEKLGMEIVCEGGMPEELEGIMTKAVRECLVNTVRHGGGDKVFVRCLREDADRRFTAVIKDNGHPKEADGITEGGGLSSLRKSVEEIGGTMMVDTKPEFMVTLIFNNRKA